MGRFSGTFFAVSAAGPTLELANFLPYRLSVVATQVSRQLAALYAQRFGISIPQWRTIAVLGQSTNVSADFVCEQTQMDRVTVSRAVAGLLARRLILRRYQAHDRRCSVLRLAAAGRRLYRDIVPLARGYENALLGAMSAQERATLARALDVLGGQLHALDRASPS